MGRLGSIDRLVSSAPPNVLRQTKATKQLLQEGFLITATTNASFFPDYHRVCDSTPLVLHKENVNIIVSDSVKDEMQKCLTKGRTLEGL